MKKQILIALFALWGTAAAAQNTDNKLAVPFDRYVDSVVREAYKKKELVDVMIGIIRSGGVQTYAYGGLQQGKDFLPDVNTVFEIGSITKTFTGLLLALQVQRGKMKADDPVNRYLPDSVRIPSNVTMVSLSNHTSGLPRFEPVAKDPDFDLKDPYTNFTVAKLFSYLRTFKPAQQPGTKYDYSNIGAGLLGTLIARNSNAGYGQLLQREICLPLQLKDTRLEMTESMKSRLAEGHLANGKPTTSWDFKALAPCGGIKSTMKDMLVYTKANMSTAPTILEKAMRLSHQATYTGNDAVVAMGWHLIPGARTIVWHNGQTGGYYSMIFMDPASGKAVIVLSNISKQNSIAQALMARM